MNIYHNPTDAFQNAFSFCLFMLKVRHYLAVDVKRIFHDFAVALSFLNAYFTHQQYQSLWQRGNPHHVPDMLIIRSNISLWIKCSRSGATRDPGLRISIYHIHPLWD